MTVKILPVISQQPHQQQQSSSSNPLLYLSPFSWLFHNRRRRILILTVCSPLLLPLLCLSFPVLFLCQLYICLFRRRQRWSRRDDGGLRRCEEGREREVEEDEEEEEEREIGWMLLQRYLEDQLGLVGSVVSVYDCGDVDEDDDDDFDDLHQINDLNKRPFLI